MTDVLADVAAAIAAAVPCAFVTMSRWFPEQQELERVWSGNGAVYPVGGRKHKPPSAWSDRVLRDGLPSFAVDAREIERAFDDHMLIARHGITTILNVPVVLDGVCAGTINLMRDGEPFGMADAVSVAAVVGPQAGAVAAAMRAFVLIPAALNVDP